MKPVIRFYMVELLQWMQKVNMHPNGFGGWGGDFYNANYHGSKSENVVDVFMAENNRPELQKHYGLYQLCPKCDGQKTVSTPPGTPADVRPCSSWEASYPCDICKGEGVIPRPEIKNMQP